MKMDKVIKRGDLVYLNFDPIVGSEQGGPRPAVVVQNDMGNKHAPTVIIAPVTVCLRIPARCQAGSGRPQR